MAEPRNDAPLTISGTDCPQCANDNNVQAGNRFGDFHCNACGTEFHRVRIHGDWGAGSDFWSAIYSGQAPGIPPEIEWIAFHDASTTDWMTPEQANEILTWAATIPGWPAAPPYPLLLEDGAPASLTPAGRIKIRLPNAFRRE